MDRLSIFVSGVSANRREIEVRDHFQRFGSILSVILIRTVKRGFSAFKVIPGEKSTYQRILNFKYHNLDGRVIQCQPFVSGKELQKANMNMNHRRMIIKNAPANLIDEEVLKSLIEKQFGKVDTLFKLKNDTEYQPEILGQNQKWNAFSVLFEREEAANNAKSKGFIYYPKYGIYLKIESFRYKKYNAEENEREQIINKLSINPRKVWTGQQSNLNDPIPGIKNTQRLPRNPSSQ